MCGAEAQADRETEILAQGQPSRAAPRLGKARKFQTPITVILLNNCHKRIPTKHLNELAQCEDKQPIKEEDNEEQKEQVLKTYKEKARFIQSKQRMVGIRAYLGTIMSSEAFVFVDI